ncbi:MAG: GntR family transcriptional regulator [Desulfobacterales bacterium]|nr:GntR family transcriptional regulator [Desulfobacterales bacterium]
MAKLRKAKTLSLVKDVSQQIEEAILSGEYRPGDRLPSTRDLQEILGASLGTIRESLAILEQKGLLEVRKGAKGGFFIRELSTEPLEDNLDMLMRHRGISHRELYEFRTTNEAGVLRLVVQKGTDEQLDGLNDFLNRMKACLGQGNPGWIRLVDIENEMRRAFLKIIRNRTYDIVLTPIINNLQRYARNHLPGGDEETRIAFAYWEKIIPAIQARDEEKAAGLIKKLLLTFMDIIIGFSGEEARQDQYR